MPISTIHPKTTIWLWPTSLFPRRIIYFLRAKNISTSTLAAHNIHLIPVTLSPTGLISLAGFEDRPVGTSLPIMRVETDSKEVGGGGQGKFWIRESAAMMEYLGEVFSPVDGYKDLRGSTIFERARC